jgi:hypothetical protein
MSLVKIQVENFSAPLRLTLTPNHHLTLLTLSLGRKILMAMLFSENYSECGMGPLHHEWRHLRGIANTMWSYVYPLLNEQVENFCYCPSHNIPLGGGESQIPVADPRGQLDH